MVSVLYRDISIAAVDAFELFDAFILPKFQRTPNRTYRPMTMR